MKFDHGAFQVSDLDRSVQFYTEKLGFSVKRRTVSPEVGEAGAIVSLNGVDIELIQDLKSAFTPLPEPRAPYCPHLCFSVDDLDAELSRLERGGVPVVFGPMEIPGEERWLYFADPDNNMLEYIVWYH